jgi:hypothetical protein
VLGAVTQFEKSVIAAKLCAARMRRRRATGWCEGRKRFGEHPGEQVVLHRIRQLHRKPRGHERVSYGAIAAALNAERLPTRTGAPWRAGTVRRIFDAGDRLVVTDLARCDRAAVSDASAAVGAAMMGSDDRAPWQHLGEETRDRPLDLLSERGNARGAAG